MGIKLYFLVAGLALLFTACAPAAPQTSTGQVPTATITSKVITVADLNSMLLHKDFLLVNVHIPYIGEINGTDFFLPYNEIEKNLDKLPDDKGVRIVIYCQSGAMSAKAARTLVGLGYSNITDVEGGMLAWEKAGYPLTRAAR